MNESESMDSENRTQMMFGWDIRMPIEYILFNIKIQNFRGFKENHSFSYDIHRERVQS